MKRFVLAFLATAGFCGFAAAQDLPPEILVDQYMLEAKHAMEDNNRSPERRAQGAFSAFERIEALGIAPPLEYRFLYGKVLVEFRGGDVDAVLKAKSLLKQYVIEGGRKATYYTSALELLSKISHMRTDYLHWAAEQGSTETAKALIAAGADVNEKNGRGNTPLREAAGRGHTDIAKALIAAGADVSVKNNVGSTPLHKAAGQGSTETAKVLIAAGADVNVKNNGGSTPLHVAAEQGSTETAKVLIAAGADVNVKDNGGSTPLYTAANWGRTETAKVLIAAGADVNVKDDDGVTPLYVVVEHANWPKQVVGNPHWHWDAGDGYTETVKALIAAGADVNAKRNYGSTPLGAAFKRGSTEIAKVLIAEGADVNSSRWLHWVIEEYGFPDRTEIVKALIAGGADLNVKNSDGKRPRRLANENGNKYLARILKDAGAKK